ncbi:MAG: LuxR family transcriptional regulator, partial [Salinibacterium sp.]|nr:LuxR family transcriptional regulator [Salinibacterium sp.]
MRLPNQPSSTALLRDLHTVLLNPLPGIAPALSELLSPLVHHSALVIFTEDCTGRPQKRAGEPSIADRVTVAELDVVKEAVRSNNGASWAATGIIAGSDRLFAGWIASSGALMVLTDPILVAPTAETLDEVMV